jgi:peptide-methionine (R)-S-oxide reductase
LLPLHDTRNKRDIVGWQFEPARQTDMAEQPKKDFEVTLSDEEWRQKLNPAQYQVLRHHGTERAGSSPLDKKYDPGVYYCAGCGQPLFEAATKYNSRSGWPSFYEPIEGAVATETDRSHFMVRTEAHCSKCGGHLGHVFDDGPKPTGLRYCMNGLSLDFHADENASEAETGSDEAEKPTGGGA